MGPVDTLLKTKGNLREIWKNKGPLSGHGGKTNGASAQRSGDQLTVKMEAPRMSAFGGKADINHQSSECPLIAKSGHSDDG